MANPFDQFDVAQAPIVRPDPIPRPSAVERPDRDPPQRKRAAPPARAKPSNPFDRFDDPARDTPNVEAVPDNERFRFTASVPKDMQAVISEALAKAPPEIRKKVLDEWQQSQKPTWAPVSAIDRQNAIKGHAEQRAAQDKIDSPVFTYIDDTVRNFVRGTPIGSWVDEIDSAARDVAHRVTDGRTGTPYELAMAEHAARNRRADTDTAKLGTLPLIGDVTAAGLTKLAGGVASLPVAPAVAPFQGATMLPRVRNSVATGATYGGIYGAGEGENLLGRLQGGATGMAIGSTIGAAVPPIQSAIGNVFGRMQRPAPQGPLQAMDRSAVDKIVQTGAIARPPVQGYGPPVPLDAAHAPAAYRAQIAQLGPEGMLADMGPTLRSDAARLARNPGPGREAVVTALETRKAGAPDRIRQDVDQALGRYVNVPEITEQLTQAGSRRARPYYDQFYQTPIPYTQNLVTILQRVPQSAWGRAQQLAEMEGVGLQNVMHTGRGIDLVKRAVDDLAQNAERGSNEARIASGLARALRTEVDTLLSPGNPAQSSWALARRFSGDGIRLSEAVDEGRGAFSRGLSPDQMRYDLQRMTPAERTAYRYGGRDQVRQTMGNAATSFEPNGDVAARRLLGSDNARAKLEMIAQPGGADRLTRRLDAESQFQRTLNDATKNSITASMQASAKRWPAADGGEEARSQLRQSSLQGMALSAAHRIVNVLRGGALNERTLREQRDAAQILVAQGHSRDAIAQALIDYAQRRGIAGRRRQAVEAVVRDVLTAPRQLLIDKAQEAQR